jgi:hypothetical protein
MRPNAIHRVTRSQSNASKPIETNGKLPWFRASRNNNAAAQKPRSRQAGANGSKSDTHARCYLTVTLSFEVFADLAKEFRENTKNTLEGAALKLREEVTQGSITPSEAAQKLIEQAPAGMAASAKIAAREAARAAFENGGSLLKVVSQLKATPEQTQAVSKAVAMSK